MDTYSNTADLETLFPGAKTADCEKIRYLESLGKQKDLITLGSNTSTIFQNDPKLLLFTLSRYKFVSKMFSGFNKVLEIGCQEGFGAQIIAQEVNTYVGVDFFVPHIKSANERNLLSNASYIVHDILNSPVDKNFDGAFALDVLEHIEPDAEHEFMLNLSRSLNKNGSIVLGMPSLESQRYASEASKKGHVNCKSGMAFRLFVEKYFQNCFLFSMNDEVLHTGFHPMSHYLFVLACNKK